MYSQKLKVKIFKMKTTDFAKYLNTFLTQYLPGERNVSSNTILSYKHSFIQFITFMKDVKSFNAERLTLDKITKECIVEFLDWIQMNRHCCNATRNYRLAALHSFFSYLQYENPERMSEWQKILSIKIKKHDKKNISYLTTEGIKLIFEQPDLSTQHGRRNLSLLALMYDSGARIQEIIDLTPSCIRFDYPPTIKLLGKGKKTRIVPLQEEQIVFLKEYMQENHLLEPSAVHYPLFSNYRKEKLTSAGLTYILNTYVNMVRKNNPTKIPEKISCHSLRHSKAMHLLQAGVNLVYIRDFLGHVSVTTTDIYARADSKQKRDAFEKAYVETKPEVSKIRSWEKNKDLLDWLKSIKK